MRTITIIYQRHHYLYRWLKPMFASKNEFKKLGYKVEYQSLWDYLPVFKGELQRKQEHKAIKLACGKKHDIVMLAFHHSTSDLCSKMSFEERACILKEIRTKCNMLIWLDTADSTGTCMFDVMPYVDLYFKKQLLKDKSLYCRDLYGARLFCDYYHKFLGIEDPQITERAYPPTSPKYLNKLRISWNVALGDLYATPLQMLLHPHTVKRPRFLSPDTDRSLDVQYRGNGYSPIAGYPRSEASRLIQQIDGISISDVTKKIPKKEYIAEGMSSKAILSPFGWGEICGRDFEAFVYGACMIKQSMEPFETYPDLYKSGITYVPLKWDFSDFKVKVLKAASEDYKRIAKEAQSRYKFYFTNEGRKEFANHIVTEIERSV